MEKLFYVFSFCALFFGLCAIAFSFWFRDSSIGIGFVALLVSLLCFTIGNLWSRVKDLEKQVKELKDNKKEGNNS